MPSNFTRSSESLTFVTEILGYIVGIASMTCSSILIFIAVRKSPREMSAYKWYIIFHAASCAGFDLLYGLFHPEPLFPQIILMSGGLFKHWIIPNYMVCFFFYTAFIFLYGIIYSILLLFLYKYLQSINSKFHVIFSRGLRSFVLCSAGFCLYSIPAFIVLSNAVTPQSELKEFLRANQPTIYDIAQNRNIIGIENSTSTLIYAFYCWATIIALLYSVTLIYCVYGCYASMQRGKSAFSSRTLQLYRSLVNALLIDLAICVVMVIFPCGLLGICVYFQVEWASTATLLTMMFGSWYPLVSHILWLWFIVPYRRALIRVFKGGGKTTQAKNSNIVSPISKHT